MAVFTSGRTIRDALKSAAQGCNLFPYPFELFPSHLHSSKLRPVQLVRWRTCWPAIPLELVGFKRGRAPDATGSAGALCDLLALGAGRVTNGTQTQARSTMMGGDRRGLLRPRQLVHPRRAGLRPIRPRMAGCLVFRSNRCSGHQKCGHQTQCAWMASAESEFLHWISMFARWPVGPLLSCASPRAFCRRR